MPTYSYECQKCGVVRDVFHSMSATPKVKCPECSSGRVKRLLGTGAGLIFKGSGFYETDYKRGNGSSDGKSSSEAKSDSGTAAKPAAKAESKSEPKTESKSKKGGTTEAA